MAAPGTVKPDLALGALVGAFAAVCLLLFCRGHLSSGDEVNVFATTRAIAERGSLAIPPVPNARRGVDGRFYSPYSIGQPLAVVPFYELGRALDAVLPPEGRRVLAGPSLLEGSVRWGGDVEIFTSLLYGPFATGLLVALFFLIQRELGTSARTAVAVSVMLGLGTYVALMSSYLLRHTSEGVAALGGLYFLLRFGRTGTRRDLAWGAGIASATLLMRLPGAAVAVGFAVFVLPQVFTRWRRRRSGRELVLDLLALGAPAAAILAVHLGVNFAQWGTLFSSPMVQENSRFPYPIYLSAWGFLLSPGASIFVYSPLLLLAPAALAAFRREQPLLTWTIVTVFGTFLLFFSLYDGWTGLWSAPGPRYLFLPLLFLMLPLGRWLDAGGRQRWAWACGLFLCGAFFQTALLATQFGSLANELRYPDYEPQWSFLFVPDANSPVIASIRSLLAGRHQDMWIVRLAAGSDAHAGHPGVAGSLLAAWMFALAACATGIGRLARRADRSSTGASPAPLRADLAPESAAPRGPSVG